MSNERDSDKDESAIPLQPPSSDPFGQNDPFGQSDPFAPTKQYDPYNILPEDLFGVQSDDSSHVAVELGFSAPVDYTAETYQHPNTDPFGTPSGVDPFATPDPFAAPSSLMPTTVHLSQLDTFGSILEAQYGPSIHKAITELALEWLGSPVSLQFRLARLASREELSFVLLLPGMRAVRQRFVALKADLASETMRPAFESVKLLWEGVKNQAALEPTFSDLSLANPNIHQAAMNILDPCERLVLENCPAKAPHGLLRKYRLIYFGIVADQYS